MDVNQLPEILEKQRAFFRTGKTLSEAFRREQLQKFRTSLAKFEDEMIAALASDLRKPAFEGYLSEVWFTIEELKYAEKKLHRWMKPKKVKTPLLMQPGSSRIVCEPKGVVLIIGPWNYPLQLVLSPLIAAIAAGNCAILKPSEFAPATSRVVTRFIAETFPPEFVACFTGGVEVSTKLLENRFDHIFFTGGIGIGKVVMTAAAKYLTPVTLELGGKSPCIVDNEINLSVTAKRIVWGKFFNAGQTCVAPDYLLVNEAVKAPLLKEMAVQVKAMFGENPSQSKDYARIVNERHFHRLKGLLASGNVAIGGDSKADQLYIAPTVLEGVTESAPVMKEEIFGPILPVLTYQNFDEALKFVKDREKPLALYLFSSDSAKQDRVVRELSFGGGCLNDTLVHLQNPGLPFGGVGESGMGAYHGEIGFQELSHRKSVFKKPFYLDNAVRYPPYGNRLAWFRKWLG